MKKFVFVALLLCVATTSAFAEGVSASATATVTTPAASTTAAPAVAAPAATTETMTLTGTIIDNNCAGANKADLATFVKTHPKSCALSCADSGYAIFADGKLSKFDKESGAKIAEFLKKEESKTQVVVTAKKVGEELSLVSIENQK
jgi:hypothetical protein